MSRPEDLGIYNRCSSCRLEWYQCRTQAELGYGRCCFHCYHPSSSVVSETTPNQKENQ